VNKTLDEFKGHGEVFFRSGEQCILTSTIAVQNKHCNCDKQEYKPFHFSQTATLYTVSKNINMFVSHGYDSGLY
jgi:hypothetical protein